MAKRASDATYWQFKIPTLPRRVYAFVKEFSEEHEVSHWHTILMGLRLLSETTDDDLAALKKYVTEKYPYPGSPQCH